MYIRVHTISAHVHLPPALVLPETQSARRKSSSHSRVPTRYALNRIINSQQRDGCLVCRLQTPHFAQRRLQDARHNVVSHVTIHEIKPISQKYFFGITSGCVLRCVVVGTELRDQLGRIFCCVDGKLLWN